MKLHKFNQIQKLFISSLLSNAKNRTKETSMAIAMCLVPQINSNDTCNSNAFLMSKSTGVNKLINELNEIIPIDIDTVMELTSALWQAECHRRKTPPYANIDHSVFLGHLTEEEYLIILTEEVSDTVTELLPILKLIQSEVENEAH